jgi:hypothetical protein
MTGLWLLISLASATPHVPTSREPLPAREVERPVVLPRGWSQLQMAIRWRKVEALWNGGAANHQITTFEPEVRHGLARGVDVGIVVPAHVVDRPTRRSFGPAERSSLGDPALLVHLALLRTEPPNSSIALALHHSSPAGGLPHTLGAPATRAALVARRQVGGIGITADAGYQRRWAAPARWLPPSLQEDGPNPVVALGDVVDLSVEILLQGGPLVLALRPSYQATQATRLGRGPVVFPAETFLPVVEGGTSQSDLGWRVTTVASRGLSLSMMAEHPLHGRAGLFFPLERISPGRATTWASRVDVRW